MYKSVGSNRGAFAKTEGPAHWGARQPASYSSSCTDSTLLA
jgi:hypothetical protein